MEARGDTVEIVDSLFNKSANFNTGSGADYVNFERTTFATSMSVNTGRDDDYVAFRASTFGTVPKPGRFTLVGSLGLDGLDAGLLATPNFRSNLNAERLRFRTIDDLVT